MFEHVGRLHRFLIKIYVVAAGRLTFEGAVLSRHFAIKVLRLYRGSGLLFTALYLKQCSVALQQYYAKSTFVNTKPSVMVSLSRCGLPRIIPTHHRHIIMSRSERADHLVKVYLSWFSLCRIIKLAPKVNRNVFDSIVGEPPRLNHIGHVLTLLDYYFDELAQTYMPWLKDTMIQKGIRWVPTWKSIPNDDRRMKTFPKAEGNVFSAFKFELVAFANFSLNLKMLSPFGFRMGQAGSLWHHGVLRPFQKDANRELLEKDFSIFNKYEHRLFEPYVEKYRHLPLATGRITSTLSGAGKRRLFVIGNSIIQRLLYPVHSWAMGVLSRLPCDGTFEQERPIHRLRRFDPSNVSSFDLSSATDRWPVAFITRVISLIFGDTAGEWIVLGTLSNNVFTASYPLLKKGSNRLLYFKTGQPLGYYGSWALFSLSHHILVWMAARIEQDCWNFGPFNQYALLGDDIVISSPRVAKRYRRLVHMLGVSISESKSLDSPLGALEFAKQFWMYNVRLNLTPVSASAVLSIASFLGLVQIANKYSVSKKTLIRLAGAGFRVRSRILSPHLSIRWKRLLVVADKSLSYHKLPLDLWFGRGKPLNPYLKGIIVDKVLTEYQVKQLILVPDQYWEGDRDTEVLMEYTLYRNWLQKWLEWVHWHTQMSLDKDPSLEDLFNPPIVSTHWKRSMKDIQKVRYGFLWKCWDIGDGWDLTVVPGCLTPLKDRSEESTSNRLEDGRLV